MSPLSHLEGRNIADGEVQNEIRNSVQINDRLQEMLAGQNSTVIFKQPSGESITTGYPVIARGEPVYFIFLETPTSSIFSQIENTLFAQQIQTVALFGVSASAISILVIFLARMNSTLPNAISERTGALESASTKLESLNKELEVKNMQLSESNKELMEKENAVENALAKVLDTEKAKDEFISMISHELKTPLVPIKGYSEMLKSGVRGDLNDKQREAVLTVLKSTEKFETLVGDVMDVFKLDMNKMKLSMADVNAAALISQTVSDLESIAEEKKVELRAEATAGNIEVFCDPRRIDQVLANLIKNSIDFVLAKGGKVVVKVEKGIALNAEGEKEMAIFAVEDNGRGIPQDKIDKVFEKFYQVDTGATRKHGGTSLGLVICRGIVEAHWENLGRHCIHERCVAKFSLPLSSEKTSGH